MGPIQDTIRWLQENGELEVIDEPLDVSLEIPHIAYIKIKSPDAKPLLFTRPIDKRTGIEYDIPVLMNLFANTELTQKILGKHPDSLAQGIEKLLTFRPPRTLKERIKMLPMLWRLKNVFPKKSNKKGRWQYNIWEDIDLEKLPILKTWQKDGGAFITMGQVYTMSLEGTTQNLGMYRLQRLGKRHLAMHWQIHKDASHFFDQYRNAGKKMPVTIAIGGDPLYIWCAQAPMPHGVFELLLYGYIRNKNPQLVRSLTNEIYIPKDVDIVIEGEVDPDRFELEGPFGDHTGYYTLQEPFPVLEVKSISTSHKPVYTATVVGKPPLEDKYMGWATERIFLPLLKPIVPELIDYILPENGVFHNLVIVKIDVRYPAHALQCMHAFWGVGQMSFVKHAIFVAKDAPDLKDYTALTRYILDRIDTSRIFISEGVLDHLDHSSPKQFEGGKLGIDATAQPVLSDIELLSDEVLLKKMQKIDTQVICLKQYFTQSANPICVIAVKKTMSQKVVIEKLKVLSKHIKILVIVDELNNDIRNPYMLIWRVTNNIDAKRDITLEPFIAIDATNKSAVDAYTREWPQDTHCTKEVLEGLMKKGLIEIDTSFIKKYGILPFNGCDNG